MAQTKLKMSKSVSRRYSLWWNALKLWQSDRSEFQYLRWSSKTSSHWCWSNPSQMIHYLFFFSDRAPISLQSDSEKFFYKASRGNISLSIIVEPGQVNWGHWKRHTIEPEPFNHAILITSLSFGTKQLMLFFRKISQVYCSLKEQLKTCINWSWPERLICRCFAHGSPCLTVLTIGNLVIVNVVSRWYCFPTRFKPELYHSTIHHCCSALVVCCVLFVYCDIMYNVCMYFILLWERCLAWMGHYLLAIFT